VRAATLIQASIRSKLAHRRFESMVADILRGQLKTPHTSMGNPISKQSGGPTVEIPDEHFLTLPEAKVDAGLCVGLPASTAVVAALTKHCHHLQVG
jgi:hypothetical protein